MIYPERGLILRNTNAIRHSGLSREIHHVFVSSAQWDGGSERGRGLIAPRVLRASDMFYGRRCQGQIGSAEQRAGQQGARHSWQGAPCLSSAPASFINMTD